MDSHSRRLRYVVVLAEELQFARSYPRVDVDLREYTLVDQTAGLADGSADVAIVRPPITDGNIEWRPLFTEPRVLTVPSAHPLADRSHVVAADILHIPLAIGRSPDREHQ